MANEKSIERFEESHGTSKWRFATVLFAITATIVVIAIIKIFDLGPTAQSKYKFLEGHPLNFRGIQRVKHGESWVLETYNIHTTVKEFAKVVKKTHSSQLGDDDYDNAEVFSIHEGRASVLVMRGRLSAHSIQEFQTRSTEDWDESKDWITVYYTYPMNAGFSTSAHDWWEELKGNKAE